MGEFELIAWIQAQSKFKPESVVLGPGDDCAVVRQGSQLVLVTTDMLMDGVDFRVGQTPPRLIGRKALAANLSDIAAMAGVPRHAVVSLALPKHNDAGTLAQEIYLGLSDIAAEFHVAIIGGDTNSWPGPLVIAITLTGDVTDRGFVTRSGARPGDWLFVTGPLGGSITGHHLTFTPRVREASDLHRRVTLRAMIDISDGLAADLKHILDASGCGAVLDAAAIPIRPGSNLAGALGDGEDFELLFAVSPEDGHTLQGSGEVWRIGECTDSGLWLSDRGQVQPLAATGWEHQF